MAESLFPLPPKLVDLKWTPAEHDAGLYIAPATKQFWLLWTPRDKPVLRECGINIKVATKGYDVHFAPLCAVADYQQRLDALCASMAEHIAEQARQDRAMDEWLAKKEVERAEQEREWAIEVDAARAQITDYLKRFDAFIEKKDREVLQRLSVKETLWIADIKLLKQTIRSIDVKSSRFARDAKKFTGEQLDWTEDKLVRAVRHMTGLDADRSVEANNVGWNKPHSSWGHWCRAVFGTEHHDAAIHVARHICATYVDTQLKNFTA